MTKLSLKSYVWKCIIGSEIFYVACLSYGMFLSGEAQRLHHSFFGLIPGFTWGSIISLIWGAVYIFIVAWIFGSYMVWMHNSSLIK